MSQQPRYRRTERARQAGAHAAQPEPAAEEYAEKRARYGSFTTYMVALLILAAIIAVVAAVILWPD
ncbi:MAG TPA: hypothetical protein VFH62_02845 [Dehalococcoidia bacterium]|nr:hypothetical protein [Dehalococcoidia bacterium]